MCGYAAACSALRASSIRIRDTVHNCLCGVFLYCLNQALACVFCMFLCCRQSKLVWMFAEQTTYKMAARTICWLVFISFDCFFRYIFDCVVDVLFRGYHGVNFFYQ